ncbi:molybdopterin-binding protein [Paraburkholderia sp. 40]|uniref:molybdopterin-binding protein n=1 Tax=unclassified Paraburkholderia TaxID=2615204 RepID=UPI003D1CFD02
MRKAFFLVSPRAKRHRQATLRHASVRRSARRSHQRTSYHGREEARARAIHATLRAFRAQSDLIVMTGGASVGERDMARSALTSLGASFVLCGMRMKPGKPAALAQRTALIRRGLCIRGGRLAHYPKRNLFAGIVRLWRPVQ